MLKKIIPIVTTIAVLVSITIFFTLGSLSTFFALLVVWAFFVFMFASMGFSCLTDVGGLTGIAGISGQCESLPYISSIILIPITIALLVYIVPFLGD